MNRPLWERVGYGLLAVAPLVFGIRAVVGLAAGPDLPGWAFAVAGIFAGAGFLTLILAMRGTRDFARVLIAAAVAVVGHTLIARFVDPALGAAMVYLGTGFAGSLRLRSCAYAGLLAGTGAILRDTEARTLGLMFVAAGGLLLAGLLAWTAMPRRPEGTG